MLGLRRVACNNRWIVFEKHELTAILSKRNWSSNSNSLQVFPFVVSTTTTTTTTTRSFASIAAAASSVVKNNKNTEDALVVKSIGNVPVKSVEDIPKNLKLAEVKLVLEPEVKEFVYVKGDALDLARLKIKIIPNPFNNNSSSSSEQVFELPTNVFATNVNLPVMARVIRWQRNRRMMGTHKAKTKGEVSGTGKKPHPQKGTGAARQGSKRNPHMRGGGKVFPPSPRSHAHDLNKKERLVGLRSALVARFQEGNLYLVDSVRGVTKTKQVSDAVQRMGWKQPLVVGFGAEEGAFVQACRNVEKVNYLPPIGVNVLDVVKHRELVVSLAALGELLKRFEKIAPRSQKRVRVKRSVVRLLKRRAKQE